MSNPKVVLVASHPRSGTHFCINALCLNLKHAEFPLVRGQYPTLERLVLDHDEDYSDEWEQRLRDDAECIKIFKTHMRPADIIGTLDDERILNARDRRLLRAVYENSRIVYVYRDGRDALVSWYHYMQRSGGGLPSDLPARIARCAFSEFLKMPNLYFPPVRGIGEADGNRARFWSTHVNDWLDREGTVGVSYESLHQDFDATIRRLASSLDLAARLFARPARPPFVSSAGAGLPGKLVAEARRRLWGGYHRVIRGVESYPPSPAYSRKGAIGDWREHFGQEDLDFFMEHAGETMRRLGYES